LISSKEFTLYGNPSYYSDNGGYLMFDPTGSQYAEATSLPSSLSNWSVEVWHYYTGNNSGSSPCIVTEAYTGGPINFTLGNCTDSSPNLQVGHWDGSSFYPTPQGITLAVNRWHHIVGVFDGSAHKLYLNGVLTASTPTSAPANRGGVGIVLMRRWDYTHYWGGALAAVRIYDRDIGQDGIRNNFNVERSRFGL
jgi:hypothetical protein